MRRTILLILLAALGYVGWYYARGRRTPPLQARLLRIERDAIDRIRVVREGPGSFTAQREGSEYPTWTVINTRDQHYRDEAGRLFGLIDQLSELRTDSLYRYAPGEGDVITVEVSTRQGSERLALLFPNDPSVPVLAGVGEDDQRYALPEGARRLLPYLTYDHYRDPRLLPPRSVPADTFRFVVGDSVAYQTTVADSVQLQVAFFSSPPIAIGASPNYADWFDYLADRDHRIGTLEVVYGTQKDTLGVFHNESWPLPYVIATRYYPRRYLALDSLTF